MSFLSRKPARSGGRGDDAGRDEYDDFDGYAHDGYQNEDDDWSPGEYFSPEGIKGRWAGEQPEGRAGGRGGRAPGRGDAGPGYDSYGGEFSSAEYGGPGYGTDEFTSGAYDLPDGADEDRPDRSRRRRRDREDRGERTGILRLRRDRGEDIWPDDGISDEDYWASVAADRPLDGTAAPTDNGPGVGGGNSRPGMSGPDSRFGGGPRGATGRLGPPPGITPDYKPGIPGSAGRPGTGPQAFRPGTGPTPTVGVTASRPPAGQNGMRPGPAQPGTGSNGLPQPAARPSFQPNGYQPAGGLTGEGPTVRVPAAGGPAGSRQQDRTDWGDRTERIDRVTASGYPDSRSGGRSQGPGTSGGPAAPGPAGRAPGFNAGPPGAPGFSPAAGRGRAENPSWQPSDRREPDRREPGRDSGRETSGSWPTAARGAHARGGADDPLTSTAYSRSALAETDGRSYRAAARRSQSQTKLSEPAETFVTGQYQQSSQYQGGRTGEYWQYRDDAPTANTQAPRYPAPGGQGAASQGPAGHQAQPGRTPASPGQGQAQGGQPGPSDRNAGRTASGLPSGQYDTQQPRPSQQPPRHRQAQSPATGLPSAAPSAGAPAGSAAGSPASARPSGSGGLNPYDSAITGSHPYARQPYPARSTSAGPVQDAADDRYYRPSSPDGYAAGSANQSTANQSRADQSKAGYGNGYPATEDRRYQ